MVTFRSDFKEFYFFNKTNFFLVARGFFQKKSLQRVRNLATTGQFGEFGVGKEALRLNPHWFSVWEAAKLDSSVSDFSQVIYPPMIRVVEDKKSFVPWHQDEAYIKGLGSRAHREFITCFVPLDDDPSARPTLQFCLNPEQGPLFHIERGGFLLNRYDLREGDKPRPSQCVSYGLELGDALVFGKFVLHRTYFSGGRWPARRSMEFRLTTRETLISGKDYFDLESKTFYTKE